MPSKKGVSVLKFLQGYYPFGGTFQSYSQSRSGGKNHYTFNGNEEQVELQLSDFNARYYDNNLGRFINIDPLADAAVQLDQSPYQFGWNNPTNLNDPSGECPVITFCNGLGQGALNTIKGIGSFARETYNTGGQNIVDGVKNVDRFVTLAQNAPSVAKDVVVSGVKQAVVKSIQENGSVSGAAGAITGEVISGSALGILSDKGLSKITGVLRSASNVTETFGDLTKIEVSQIQNVVDEAGRPLEVVGSAAKGSRRNPGSDLPIGKGPGTKSDIDFTTSGANRGNFNGLENKLPSPDPQTPILQGGGDPRLGPVIRFEPELKKPTFIPKSKE